MITSAVETEAADIQRLRSAGVAELADQFAHARSRLKKMIDMRLDRKLLARVDSSDIVQEAFIEASRRLPEFLEAPKVSPYMWLRQIGRQTLAVHYRQHVGTAMRAVDLEVGLNRLLNAHSESMVGDLAASMASAHSTIAKAELLQQMLKLVESMTPEDRDVLSLKQLEQLTFEEVAEELNINVEAAKKRYQRAVIRLGRMAGHLQDRSVP